MFNVNVTEGTMSASGHGVIHCRKEDVWCLRSSSWCLGTKWWGECLAL